MGRSIPYTEEEIRLIRLAYQQNSGSKKSWLADLANSLGREKSNICRYARGRGWTDRQRVLDHPGRMQTLRV